MKVWVTTEFTDENGKHEVGEPLDLPRNTDVEKAEFDRLIEYGIVSKNEPPRSEGVGEDGATSRRRRD